MDVFANVQCHRDLLKGMTMTDRYQFERKGYYCLDKDSDIASGRIIWNQTVSLVDRNKK